MSINIPTLRLRQHISSTRRTGKIIFVGKKMLISFIFTLLRTKDGLLSKEEVLSSKNLFVASQATDYGKKIKNAHDEL